MRPRGDAMKSIRAIIGERDTVTVNRLTSVRDAARLMAERQIGGVPVVDGERLVGIFTERDVMGRVVAAALNPASTPVGDVMSTQLVVAEMSESYESCLNR